MSVRDASENVNARAATAAATYQENELTAAADISTSTRTYVRTIARR